MITTSQPASTYRGSMPSGRWTMRWASKGSEVWGRAAAMTSGPMVRLGTNCPSITSHWIRSAPASSRARTSSPRREKSAGSTEGTIWTGRATVATLSGGRRPTGPVAPKRGQMGDPDLATASDATLVVAIGRWRQDALAEAYRRHAGAVFALARRLLGDPTLAEEVVQEVFVRLWDAPDRFDADRGTLRSYLLANGHGRAVDLIRSETSRRAREEREHRARAEAGYDIEHEVEDLVDTYDVKRALAWLPPHERRGIELSYFRRHT